ncbi:MAG: hypothetical protein HZB39_12285 [Planctomycetes bacterium]|nr:hypothetical protein [Planctomycetota bacterium]
MRLVSITWVLSLWLALLTSSLRAQGGTFDVKVGTTSVTVTLAVSAGANIVLYNGVLQPGATWTVEDGDGDGADDDYVIHDGAGQAVLEDGPATLKNKSDNVRDGAAPGDPVVGTYTRTQ